MLSRILDVFVMCTIWSNQRKGTKLDLQLFRNGMDWDWSLGSNAKLM